MALPIINTAVYELTVPSNGNKIKYRPFLVKEEKALLIAQQSEDQTVMLNTLKEIIKSCLLDSYDVNNLSLFDIEYVFLQLRAKSVGEFSELVFSCKACEDPKAKVKINLDISKIGVKIDPEHNKNVKLFNDVGIVLKYPSLDLAKSMQNTNDIENIFKVIVGCIEYIYDGDQIYHSKDSSREELETFITNLTQDQFTKIQKFFETMPVLEQEIEFDCPSCKYHHKHKLRGLENFF